MIERTIYPKLLKTLTKKEIIALVGSRQVGKTTLMNMLFNKIKSKNKKFISFENQKILFLFETNIDEFVIQYVKDNDYLFIDEIQYSKTSGKHLKFIYDTYKIKIIISGSSATDLSINSLSYLVGRVLVYEIFPLTFDEFINYKDKEIAKIYQRGVLIETLPFLENYFEEFLIYGGYPAVIVESDFKEKKNILLNLVNSYLLKEIREVLSFENSYEYEKLLEILAISNSNILNKSNLSSNSGISLNKIDFMLDILEKTYIISKLRPIENKKTKELIKSPKIYFLDLGFRNAILDSFSKIDLRIDKGFIYETFIFSQLIKSKIKSKFYNYKNSSEIDFIIEKDNIITAIEIKSNVNNETINKSYRTYIERYNPNIFYILNNKYFSKNELKINKTDIKIKHLLNILQIIEENNLV